MERQVSSILIIGSGVFGLSTAWALTKRAEFNNASITVLDEAGGQFPPPDSASVDSSRIIRADYADPDYTELATIAQAEWRKQGDDELGGQGRYSESGLILTADAPGDHKFGPMDYVRKSWENVAAYAASNGYPTSSVRTLEGKLAVQEYVGSRGDAGDWGYVNTFSGWAHAGKGMEWLYERVKATGRVRFVDAKVKRLETKGDRVIGARLSRGETLTADVVLVAAGAWTSELIDLRGQVEATGQVLGYVDISDSELAVLARQPVVLHMTSGLFIIPPREERVLKVARHSYGYQNPQVVTDALPASPAEERRPIVVSRPTTARDGSAARRLPAEADADLRRALRDLTPAALHGSASRSTLPDLHERPWRDTRICWYADTRDGDWLVDWHPGWKGLFVATGDSGHAYKFLPVLGDKVVDCMIGAGGKLGHKWRWKMVNGREREELVDGRFCRLVTEDGSRGGTCGLLAEELAKDRRGVRAKLS